MASPGSLASSWITEPIDALGFGKLAAQGELERNAPCQLWRDADRWHAFGGLCLDGVPVGQRRMKRVVCPTALLAKQSSLRRSG